MESSSWSPVDQHEPGRKSFYLQKFMLYETFSHFYMIGRGKDKNLWRVLKIDRMTASDLRIYEDSSTYSTDERSELLQRLHEGNRALGGLKLVTVCYGIAGFIKFQEPYYMLLITGRKLIGTILGENIYTITRTEMIPIPNPAVRSRKAYSSTENRCQKLINTVDLTKDFFFSYSYQVMRSLQKNITDQKTGLSLYETMFVWNEFLTREIRKQLKNTLWTVALVYGFFKQLKFLIDGKDFKLTLIARRSRHYAGTRFLRRGVNEHGKVANDVETEQIIYPDVPEYSPIKISSVVQNRGSIPLYWSQETSLLKIFKPVIILPKQDNYEATKLHFKNLVSRYGNPIIILDLTKTREKTPRETLLHAEYANAIGSINDAPDTEEKDRLKFLQLDLHDHARRKASKAIDVLAELRRRTVIAVSLTGVFHCQMIPKLAPNGLNKSKQHEPKKGDQKRIFTEVNLQNGVLRTNCIDCLDRTNVAQYAYGLVALGHQLQALGYLDSPDIDFENPIARDLMGTYEIMGDKLALQYGGSPAHNKIFEERRGQWRPAIEYLDLIKTVQRFVNNAYMDNEKQNAIDVFLGNPPPQSRDILKHGPPSNLKRLSLLRSFSDSNLIREIGQPSETSDVREEDQQGGNPSLVDLIPRVSSIPRSATPADFPEVDWRSDSAISHDEEPMIHREASSKFLEMDWYSNSTHSHGDEILDRFLAGIPTDNEAYDSIFSFEQWIDSGGGLYR